MKIAMVSEHASPLAALGGVDAGGQNVHVAALATAMGRQGAQVVVHTRRDDPDLPQRVALAPGVEVDHVSAGPPTELPKDELLPYMDAFAADLAAQWREDPPDVVHSHFWMSGYAALLAARELGIPVVHTFHALGVVKRRYQGELDTSPPARIGIERDVLRRADHVVATCSDEVFELVRLGGAHGRLTASPCGVDLDLFRPDGRRARRRPGLRRLVCVGRLVARKGVGNAISALAGAAWHGAGDRGRPAARELRRRPGGAPPARARRGRGRRRARGPARADGARGRRRAAALGRRGRVRAVVRAVRDRPARGDGVRHAGRRLRRRRDDRHRRRRRDGASTSRRATRSGSPRRCAAARRPRAPAPPTGAPASSAPGAATAGRGSPPRRSTSTRAWWRGRGAEPAPARPLPAPTAADGARRYALVPSGAEHLASLRDALAELEADVERLEAWGERLADVLAAGGRLLAVGNGGSAAEAQHLTAELVGRFRSERQPLSAICLHGDTSSLTAIANDYGAEEAFARQVRAHGRPGDVLIAFSTSGRSPNVVRAVEAANALGIATWGLTGGAPSPLADLCDDVLRIRTADAATTQELHLVALHVLCGAVDRELALRAPEATRSAATAPHAEMRRHASAARRRRIAR